MSMKQTKNTKSKSFFKRLFTTSFIIVTICLMVSLADLFSSLITVGGFTFVSDEINVSKYTLYAVCTSNHSSELSAKEQANVCSSLGGAGYVWRTDNAYYVIASIYENKSDAEKVMENIIDSKPQTVIKEIIIPAISISNNLSAQEKSTLTESIGIFKSAYKVLYDISISLDTSLISEVNAKLAVNEIGSNITTTIGNFNTIFPNATAQHLKLTKNALDELSKTITALIDNTTYSPYTSKIKNTYTKVIFIYNQLAKGIN